MPNATGVLVMAQPFDIVAYVYQADIYCPDCIADLATRRISELASGSTIRERVGIFPDPEALLNRWAGLIGLDREDEATFDSGDFPKVVFRDQLEEDEHCGSCGCVIS